MSESPEFLQVYIENAHGHKTWFPVRRDWQSKSLWMERRILNSSTFGEPIKDQLERIRK